MIIFLDFTTHNEMIADIRVSIQTIL
jgi:hypothetical protein